MIKLYLCTGFQCNVDIRFQISETAIYKTVQKTKEKKRGSSTHTSKDFDGKFFEFLTTFCEK